MPPKPDKPGNPNPGNPHHPAPLSITIEPAEPHFGDTLIAGYSPADPVLDGYSFHLVVLSNATTITDMRGDARVVDDVTKSISSGAAAQSTGFPLESLPTIWSGGGGDATLTLLDPTGAAAATLAFAVLP